MDFRAGAFASKLPASALIEETTPSQCRDFTHSLPMAFMPVSEMAERGRSSPATQYLDSRPWRIARIKTSFLSL